MLHFFVIADMEKFKTESCCRNWLYDRVTALQKKYPAASYETCVIPKLSLDKNERLRDVRKAYHPIAERLESVIRSAPSAHRFVAVLDARLWEKIGDISSLKSVQGLLILGYPEVLWIPVLKNRNPEPDINLALQLVEGGFNPLFDGLGVRSRLIRDRKTNNAYSYVRNDVAVTLDEECHFAELTAYMAFRFGYRVYPVSTAVLAEQVLGVDSKEALPSVAGATVENDATLVTFEDGVIEFPDQYHDSNLMLRLGDGRSEKWPLLQWANLRVLATAASANEPIARCRKPIGARSMREQAQASDFCEVTVRKYFHHAKTRNLLFAGMKPGRVVSRRFYRQCFNFFSGGIGDVWMWNIVKGIIVFAVLTWILLHYPVVFIPSLFIVVAALGASRTLLRKLVSAVFGNCKRVRTFLKIRSQWRFYPKLYPNHFPQIQIHKSGAKYWILGRKPLGGIFGLRNRCGLPNGQQFEGLLNEQRVKKILRNALQGRYPTLSGKDVVDPSHSAWGMTLKVAETLIARGRAIKERHEDIEDIIHAAVLATCACELIGHKTPALSIEALELRHCCEVLAECEFSGVHARLDVEDRWVDIHNSLWQVCRASNGNVREELFASGMSAICDKLAEILRAHGRNEEGAFLSRQSRYMHRLLLNPFLRNILVFPEWAVRGKINFCISFALFIGFFMWYYVQIIDPDATLGYACSKMYELLFSTQPNMGFEDMLHAAWKDNGIPALLGSDITEESAVQLVTTVVQVMRQLALIHIGFLAALFYDFMQRK